MPKIALIIPYFGKWPQWMDFYLYTCSKQRMVDFIYFTDCGIPSKIYPNTKFIEIDFRAYCKRVSDALNIDFDPQFGAYKLCMCKPFYGIIHKNELKDYEFWGFGDIDLIYGDLSPMLNEKNLHSYDFISAHSDRVAGHFTIMRNIEKYNTACLKIPVWKTKLESEQFYALDEDPEYAYIINPCKKYVDYAYRFLFCHFFKRNKYRYFDLANSITQPLHSKSLFKERYTTPVPNAATTYFYDLSNDEIIVPCNQWYKMSSGGGKIYLHFLFFKKNVWRQSNIYWRTDFYKIPQGFNFEKEKCRIIISTQGISIENSGFGKP